MAQRHVLSLLQSTTSSSSSYVLSIARLASCSFPGRPYSQHAPRPIPVRYDHQLPRSESGRCPLRFASSSATDASRKGEFAKNSSKDAQDGIWALPPPPPAGVSSSEHGVIRDEGRALPVPDNTGMTSPSTESERATVGASTAGADDRSIPSFRVDTAGAKEGRSSIEESESPIPNYPTLPASSSETSSTSSSPKLATPNIGSMQDGSPAPFTSPASSSRPSVQQPFDFASLSVSFRHTSQKLRTSIPPELQAKVLEWSSSVLSHSKRVAKDTERKLVELGLKVNQMTGYQEVERLKGLVFAKEDNLQSLREAARSAKEAYDQAVASRSSAQRDVNTLLERKHSWTDSDVSRFTSLVRADHASTHAVSSTSIALKEAELAVDKAFSELMQTILQRYHEEQVWSDKIRSVSTWANLIGLALNAVIFLGAVVFVEPWKRRRLVERLEERVAGMMERVEGRLGGLEGNLKEFALGGAQAVASAHYTSTGLAKNTGVAGVIPSAIGEVDPIPVIEGEVELLPSLDVGTEFPAPSTPLENSDTNGSTQPSLIDTDIGHTSPGLASSPSDTIASPPSTTSTSTLVSPAMFTPLVTTTIDNLPPYLDPLTKPSQERDMILAGLAGAAIMGAIMSVGRAVFS
ncbi:hypothetical protein IAT40_002287 [Kwoniella sp. CBS 6097]